MQPVVPVFDLAGTAPVPWSLDVASLAELVRDAAADADASLFVVGERFDGHEHDRLAAAMSARVAGEVASASLVVLAGGPADNQRIAATLDLAHLQLLVSVDWPVPWMGEPVARVRGASGHAAYWYSAAHRAELDERHMVAVVHPRYDGFLVVRATAIDDVHDLRVVFDETLGGAVEAHHAPGALLRGQQRPIDLELHPGLIPARGVHGSMALLDGDTRLAACMQLTLASSARVHCSVGGLDEGPLEPRDLVHAVEALRTGTLSPRSLALLIDRRGEHGALLPGSGALRRIARRLLRRREET